LKNINLNYSKQYIITHTNTQKTMPRKASSTQPSTQPSSDKPEETKYEILTASKWTIANHQCGVAKANKNGQGKSASISYSGKRFYIKTPKMYCPFGASKPKLKEGQKETGNEQWSIQLAFGDNNNNSDAECQLFQQKAAEFDKFMIDEGCKPDNNVGWLGAPKTKPFIRAVVESKYKSMVKQSVKEGEIQTKYPPFIRVQLPTTFKEPFEFTCEIYDKNNQLLSVSPNPAHSNGITKMIPPGSWISALLTGSIWCNAQGYGVTWRGAQIKVFPPRGAIPKGKCLVDDPDSEEEEESEKEKKEDDGEEEEKKTEETGEGEGSPEGEGTEEIIEEGDGEVVNETAPAPAPSETKPEEETKPVVTKKNTKKS
jgi:hypothetical protein